MRPVSRELATDPLQSRSLRETYEREIVRLIKKMGPNWKLLVERAHEMLLSQRGDEYDKLVFKVFEKSFLTPAERVAKRHALRTYLAGQAKAKEHLKSIGVGGTLGILPPDPKVLSLLNTRNYTMMKGISDDMAKRVKTSLTESVMLGESMEQSARRIIKDTKVPIKRARMIARTETMFALNTALVEEYKRYGIEEVEWLSAGPGVSLTGKRRCTACGKLDGKTYPVNDHPPCPLHPNCRCTLLAVPGEI